MFNQTPTDEQLADACMWYRHDFGLLSPVERACAIAIMKGYWYAIWRTVNEHNSV